MLDQLDWAEFVLVVCTETYYRRFRGHEEPGKGKGADWEGNLVTTEMYNSKSRHCYSYTERRSCRGYAVRSNRCQKRRSMAGLPTHREMLSSTFLDEIGLFGCFGLGGLDVDKYPSDEIHGLIRHRLD
jgi:hypothetical protein